MELKEVLARNNKMGYYQWLKKLDLREHEYQWILGAILDDDFRSISNFFSKPILDCTSLYEVQSLIAEAKVKRNCKRLLNDIPHVSFSEDRMLYSKYVRLNDLYEKFRRVEDKSLFYRGASSYKDIDGLIHGLESFLECVDDEYDKVLHKIQKNGIRLIYSDKSRGIILARAFFAEEVNILAGDTIWCIKNKSHFENYLKLDRSVEHRQYVLFRLFSNYASEKKIGFTTKNPIDGDVTVEHCFDRNNSSYNKNLVSKYIFDELPYYVRRHFGYNIIRTKEELEEIIKNHLKSKYRIERWLNPFSVNFLQEISKGVVNSRNNELVEYIKSDGFRNYLESLYNPWFKKINIKELSEFINKQTPKSYFPDSTSGYFPWTRFSGVWV